MATSDDDVVETRRHTPPADKAQKGDAGRFYVLVLEGGTTALHHLPWNGVVVIGRGSDAEVRLSDPSASRRHAKIRVSDGRARLLDLGSSNGTRVNDERVDDSVALRSGDVISIGDATLVLHAPAGLRPPARQALLEQGALLERIEEELDRALRYQRPLTLLLLQGLPPAVDRAAVGRALAGRLRLLDSAAFLEGGQLLVLMPELDAQDGAAAAQGVLEALREAAGVGAGGKLRAGLCTCPDDGCDADTLLASARAAAQAAQETFAGLKAAIESVTRIEMDGRLVLVADPAMGRLFDLLKRLSQSDLPVLLSGETGVGKENAAFAVHHFSPRSKRPFVAINCAAIPETLVESELFGHEKGAFSGATAQKAGMIESAHGGTLFLDEVGELPLPVQAKLLRVLEARRLLRLGELREREADVRVVAATNRDLEEEVRRGRFRQDLYFRLSAANVILPPLRERPREIPVLGRAFLDGACARARRGAMALAPETLHKLTTYGWPGNVRELRNVMEYIAATVPEDVVDLEHLPERIAGPRPAPVALAGPTGEGGAFRSLSEELRALERTRMIEALSQARGVKKAAAERLAMPLRTFTMKAKQYGIG